MWGPAKVAALIGLLALLALPSGATGTVTIGSDLARAPTVANSCGPSCTVATSSLPTADRAAGGLVSPVNGTVTMWRVRVGASTSQTTFRVIKLLSTGGLASGGGSSSMVTPPVNTTTAFPTQLPIGTGDTVGIDCCSSAGSQILASTPQAISDLWNPRLVDGAPGHLPLSMLAYEVPVNADIEPTSAFTISEVKAGKGGKETLTVTLPNAGTLEGIAAGKKKKRYEQHATILAAVANQTIRLLVRPTKLARTLLQEKDKLKARLNVTFTPTGGSPSTQTIKVKLKR
jgi:hypothetical protein